MRTRFVTGLVLAELLGAAVVARAEAPARYYTAIVPTTQPVQTGGPSSNIIYLDRCDGDCVLHPGDDDARTNTSGIVNRTTSITEFSGTATQWDEIVACVKRRYAPFGVVITDEDPGPEVEHFKAIVAGNPGEADQPCSDDGCVLGVALVDTFGCQVIDNAITYTFANVILDYIDSPISNICDTIAQETAHAFTLDHELLANDPMTYLPFDGERAFQNQPVQCGERTQQPRQCFCGGHDDNRATQNSFLDLYAIFGGAVPSPPELMITSPVDGATVAAGFSVAVTADDPQGIDRIELLVDNNVVSEVTSVPYFLNAPADLGDGNHIVTARAYDSAGTPASVQITVTIGAPCGEGDCADGLACVDGRCVVGPGEDGGLGEPCVEHADCASGLCGSDASEKFCTEYCSLDDGFCPDGFGCLSAGTSGVCWPGNGDGDGGSGGCSTEANPGSRDSSRGNGLPLAFVTLLGLFLFRRRP